MWIWVIFIAVAIGAFIGHTENGKSKKTEKDNNMKENEIQIMNDGVQKETGTRALLMHVLTQIGCQYTVEEDQRIRFIYQGEHLWAEANNDCKFINVYDAFWERCELYNVEEFSRLKRAINTVNLNETVTLFYTINEAENTLWVHCKTNLLFIPQIPELGTYLRTEFAALFQAHHALGAEVERLKREKK